MRSGEKNFVQERGRKDGHFLVSYYFRTYRRRNLKSNGKDRILVANYSIHPDLYHFLLSHGQYDLLYTIRSAIQNREIIEKFRVFQRMNFSRATC